MEVGQLELAPFASVAVSKAQFEFASQRRSDRVGFTCTDSEQVLQLQVGLVQHINYTIGLCAP